MIVKKELKNEPKNDTCCELLPAESSEWADTWASKAESFRRRTALPAAVKVKKDNLCKHTARQKAGAGASTLMAVNLVAASAMPSFNQPSVADRFSAHRERLLERSSLAHGKWQRCWDKHLGDFVSVSFGCCLFWFRFPVSATGRLCLLLRVPDQTKKETGSETRPRGIGKHPWGIGNR